MKLKKELRRECKAMKRMEKIKNKNKKNIERMKDEWKN